LKPVGLQDAFTMPADRQIVSALPRSATRPRPFAARWV
jgi:hypothetical protein